MPNTRNYIINKWTLSLNSIWSSNKRTKSFRTTSTETKRKKKREKTPHDKCVYSVLLMLFRLLCPSLCLFRLFGYTTYEFARVCVYNRLGQSEFKFYLFIFLYLCRARCALLYVFYVWRGVHPYISYYYYVYVKRRYTLTHVQHSTFKTLCSMKCPTKRIKFTYTERCYVLSLVLYRYIVYVCMRSIHAEYNPAEGQIL